MWRPWTTPNSRPTSSCRDDLPMCAAPQSTRMLVPCWVAGRNLPLALCNSCTSWFVHLSYGRIYKSSCHPIHVSLYPPKDLMTDVSSHGICPSPGPYLAILFSATKIAVIIWLKTRSSRFQWSSPLPLLLSQVWERCRPQNAKTLNPTVKKIKNTIAWLHWNDTQLDSKVKAHWVPCHEHVLPVTPHQQLNQKRRNQTRTSFNRTNMHMWVSKLQVRMTDPIVFPLQWLALLGKVITGVLALLQ